MLCFPTDRWLKSKHAHAIAIIDRAGNGNTYVGHI